MTAGRASKATTNTPTPTQTFAAKLTAEVVQVPTAGPTTPQLSPAMAVPATTAPTTPQPPPTPTPTPPLPTSTTLEYSLFNDTFTKVRLYCYTSIIAIVVNVHTESFFNLDQC